MHDTAPETAALALFEAAPVAMLALGANGEIQRLNAAARQWLGPAVAVGQAWAACFPADMPALKLLCSSGAQGQPLCVLVTLAGSPGGPARAHGAPLPGGACVVTLQPQEDDTEQLARRFDLVSRTAGVGYWVIERGTQRGTWSAAMRALAGLAPGEPVPTREEWLNHWVHPEDRESVRARQDSWAASGVENRALEFRIVRPDGQVRHVVSHSRVETSGDRGALFGVIIDITDRRSAESARLAREAAQRESEAKSRFLARMSHELRTPLNAVLGFSQLLLDDPAEAAHSMRRRHLQHIHDAGEHLLALIADVLDLASLEGGEVRIALQPVPLAPLVAQTLPLLGPLLEGQDGVPQVQMVVGTLQGSALADATRLRQVLLNLLSNAVKYNREGGRVHVEALQRGGSVVLRVADTGRGMNDDQLQHLFEPFNRLGRDRGTIEGSGIGLAIVKALVERMGGSVHVDSAVGRGTVFELRLTAAEAEAGAAAETGLQRPAPPAAAAPAPRPRRVLYIEDNPVNALIVSEMLARRPDVTLHVAGDGTQGVALATTLLPDLVLLDMQLPDFDGMEVLRRLRANPATRALHCIAVSANAMPEDIERALQAGLADYWTKPLDVRAFMAAMDTLFGPAPA